MYCVLYEFKVKPDKIDDFRRAWRIVTENVVQDYNSLGARLHESETASHAEQSHSGESPDNILIAYAQWPDYQSWQRGHVIIEEESKRMHVEKYLEEVPTVLMKMTVIDDLLSSVPEPFGLI